MMVFEVGSLQAPDGSARSLPCESRRLSPSASKGAVTTVFPFLVYSADPGQGLRFLGWSRVVQSARTLMCSRESFGHSFFRCQVEQNCTRRVESVEA